MPKQSLPCPRFEFHRNSKKEFNYRTIGKNGKSIGGEQHQGFKTLAGLKNNIIANAEVFRIGVVIEKSIRYGLRAVLPDGNTIPLIEVKK